MKMTPADPAAKEWFKALAAEYPELTVKPMFGHVAAFINGNGQMTAGTYGTDINLRLGDADRAEFIDKYQAAVFEPMPGRPMREYVIVPQAVRGDGPLLRSWMERAIAYAASLPPKKK